MPIDNRARRSHTRLSARGLFTARLSVLVGLAPVLVVLLTAGQAGGARELDQRARTFQGIADTNGSPSVYLPVIMRQFDPVTFTHGVASGDATSDGALLWTRTNRPATLTLEVASEPGFAAPAIQQTVMVSADTDFTTLFPAAGLNPGQTYYYRWVHQLSTSPTGSFHTPPAASAPVRFVYSGDSDGTLVNGQPFFNNFEALDAARADNPDFFVYLGDTIYSDSGQRAGGPATTLDEYRETYRVNRQVPALPDLLAVASTFVIWDDHEVMNDYAGQTVDPARYANGRQAFLEFMPVRADNLPADPSCAGDPLFRVYSWGPDVDLVILDERSCRSEGAEASCLLSFPFAGLPDPAPTAPAALRNLIPLLPADPPDGCLEEINNPARTLLGPVQKQLFLDFLLNSTAAFKIVINEVAIQQFYALPYDRWEGYAAERSEILNFIRDNAIENVVFLTADSHANLINEVFIDIDADPQTIAHEFVTGPIATNTLEQSVLDLLGPDGLDALNAAFTYVGVDCRDLDAYSYGLVEVDGGAGTLTVTLKDDTGTVLLDQNDGTTPCTLTLGP